MNKPIRKLTTKKLFGTKVHEELFIPIKYAMKGPNGVLYPGDIKPCNFYLNGNLILDETRILPAHADKLITDEEWAWLTYGLYRGSQLKEYNFDSLPSTLESGTYVQIENYLYKMFKSHKDLEEIIRKASKDFDLYNKLKSLDFPYLISINRVNWIEGICKAFCIGNPYNLNNNEIDCAYLWYDIKNSNLNLNPKKFICGFDAPQHEGGYFLGKKHLQNGTYDKVEIIQQEIEKHIIITDKDDSKIAIKLKSRYITNHSKSHDSRWRPEKSLENEIIAIIEEHQQLDKEFKIVSEEQYSEIVKRAYDKVKKMCYPIFTFTIYPTHQEVSIPWEEFRLNYERQASIEVGKPYNLCGNVEIQEVKSIQISDDFDYIPDLNTSIELNQQIGFKDHLTIALSFDLKEDFFAFQELKKDISVNGMFLSNLRDISDLVKKGYISGYDSVFELKAFFDNQGAIDINKESVKEKVSYLKTIKNVFIDNIVDSSQKQQVIDIIKNIIHLSSNDAQSIDKSNLKSIDIDFSKDPRIGISSKVEFLVITENDENQLNKFLKEVETGEFYSNLVRIKKLVTNSYITGFYNRLEIKDFFNEQGGNEPINEDVKKALDYLCDLSNNIIPKVKETMISEALKSIIKLTING